MIRGDLGDFLRSEDIRRTLSYIVPNTHDAATSPRARQKGHDIAELVVKNFAQLPPYIKMLVHVNINELPVLTHSSRELQDSNAMKVAGEKKERFCLVLFGHRLCPTVSSTRSRDSDRRSSSFLPPCSVPSLPPPPTLPAPSYFPSRRTVMFLASTWTTNDVIWMFWHS